MPSKYEESYSYSTKFPHKGSYTSQQTNYGKPSSHHHHYNYIKVFNEPSYYYLEDDQTLHNKNKSQITPKTSSKQHPGNFQTTITVYDNADLQVESRSPLDELNIPFDE